MINKGRFFIMISLCLFMFACANEKDNLRQYLLQIKNRNEGEIEPTSIIPPLPHFSFAKQENHLSPFNHAYVGELKDMKRCKHPLEAYSLDALKFVGTLKQSKKIWALIQLPNLELSRIRVGDYMGKNNGRVMSINQNRILLIEQKTTLKIHLYKE